jgi:hypothetical protein
VQNTTVSSWSFSQDELAMARHVFYWTELATEENTLLALLPTKRMVPTTMTRMTASITAYSAMSWPCWSPEVPSSFFYLLTKPGALRQPCGKLGCESN